MSKVGLIFGGRTVEHKVSVQSARTVHAALLEAGHQVVALGIAQDGCWLPPKTGAMALTGEMDLLGPVGLPIAGTVKHLLEAEVEVLFPIAHGTWGEDGSLQGLAEMLDLPYVGTGVTSSAVAMDKLLTKQLLHEHGLPVVDDEPVTREEYEGNAASVLARVSRLPFPVFVKPSVGGSSVGVSKVRRSEDLAAKIEDALRFDGRILVERGIDGRELECAVLGLRELRVSEIGEIVPGAEFYDYADKYLEDRAMLIAPADLPEDVAASIRRLAPKAFAAVGGWGMARVDFLYEPKTKDLFVNEINTLPGFTKISMYPRLWELSGLPLPGLVDRLVAIAFERHRERRYLDEGIRDWISELSN